MLGRGLVFFFDYFGFPVPQTINRLLSIRYTSPEWESLWRRFYIAVYSTAFMVLWIVAWTFRRLKQVQRTRDSRPTHDLSLKEHAGSLSLNPQRVSEWRKLKVATVRFEGKDLRQIANVEPGDTLGKAP